MQGCVSPYLIQSIRPAEPKFTKGDIFAQILIHCRVSFEFLFGRFWHARMATGSKVLIAYAAAWCCLGLRHWLSLEQRATRSLGSSDHDGLAAYAKVSGVSDASATTFRAGDAELVSKMDLVCHQQYKFYL